MMKPPVVYRYDNGLRERRVNRFRFALWMLVRRLETKLAITRSVYLDCSVCGYRAAYVAPITMPDEIVVGRVAQMLAQHQLGEHGEKGLVT